MRTLKGLAVLLLAAGFGLGLPALVAAADATTQARELFKQGNEQLEHGEFVEALDKFEKAYALWENPKILLNIATTLRQLGRNAEAADTYEKYLRHTGSDPARRPEVEAALRELDKKTGRLVVDVNEPGVRILLDGHPLPGDLSRVRVEPGPHTVVVEKSGFTPAVATVTVGAGEERSVALKLVRSESTPIPPPTASGTAPAATTPAATATGPATPPNADLGTQPAQPSSLAHSGQLGVWVRADIDGKFRGAVGAVGPSYGLNKWVELQAVALLGRDKGVEPGVTVYFSQGMFKPVLSVGAPTFFKDGAHPGGRISAGLHLDPTRTVGLMAQVGLATFGSTPSDSNYDKTLLIPSIGAQGRF